DGGQAHAGGVPAVLRAPPRLAWAGDGDRLGARLHRYRTSAGPGGFGAVLDLRDPRPRPDRWPAVLVQSVGQRRRVPVGARGDGGVGGVVRGGVAGRTRDRVRGVAPPARRARGRGRRRRGIRGAVLLAGVLGTPLGVGRAGRRTRPGVGRPGGDTRRRRAWLARPGRQRRRDLPQHPPVVGPQFPRP